MKSKKFVTPVLMLLLLILFALIIYLNFAHGYLTTRIDTVNRESDLFKTQRMEIEMAMQNEAGLRKDIADTKERLRELNEIYLLDSTMVSDDLLSRMKQLGLEPDYIHVDAPQFAGEDQHGGSTLLYSPVSFGFNATYNQAVTLLKGMETSKSGAYKIVDVNVGAIGDGQYNFVIGLQLYYFDDPAEVPVVEEEPEEEEWYYQ